VRNSMERVVVPVIDGVCYGCFVSIATAKAGEDEPNKALRTCESCGRFIYVLP
jgi:predicted  nucleic acid-binding Zn-ribbon protein